MSKKIVGGLSATVSALITAIFLVEGGFVNNSKDPGGATNHGITESVARANDYKGDMQDLPKELAEQIYFKDYIQTPKYDLMINESIAVAEELIDSGVNAGTSRSSLWFQKALNVLSRKGKDYPLITEDGSVGNRTIATYKALVAKRGKVKSCELMLKLLDGYQLAHYISLKHSPEFIIGWVDHRINNVPLSKCK